MSMSLQDSAEQSLLQYWGFQHLPFRKIVNTEQTFTNKGYRHKMHRLEQILLTREIGVVVGEAGTGKSTLLTGFAQMAVQSSYRVIQIDQPPTKKRELHRAISQGMGVNVTLQGADALKVVDLLTYSFVESNRPNLILIDEAHILTSTCLDELRILTNAKVQNEPLLAMVLFGQPVLASILKTPALIPLAQRVHAWITMDSLNEEDTARYIDWQLQIAGCSADIFAPAVKKALARWTKGNPRLINRLAWECLNQGYLDQASQITEEMFSHVCKSLGPHLLH